MRACAFHFPPLIIHKAFYLFSLINTCLYGQYLFWLGFTNMNSKITSVKSSNNLFHKNRENNFHLI